MQSQKLNIFPQQTFVLKIGWHRDAYSNILQRNIKCIADDALGFEILVGQHGMIVKVIECRQMETVRKATI